MRSGWIMAAALLAACGSDVSQRADELSDRTVLSEGEAQEVMEAVTPRTDTSATSIDLSSLPAGTYTEDGGHAYIQFSYDHQGFSRPVLRWSAFDAIVDYDPARPEASTLRVVIPVDGIDSMVPAFNDHLRSDDFFNAAVHPEIVFESTDIDIDGDRGTVTGDLTIKGITRPITLDGRINKVGQHFRTGKDMFGISGTGTLRRSDFDLGKYAPSVGDEVALTIEIEFQKAD